MTDYWQLWEKCGEDWRRIFAALDPPIYFFAKQHNMEVIHYRWDEPSRVLEWNENGAHKAIHIVIVGERFPYSVTVKGVAWLEAVFADKSWRYFPPEERLPSRTIAVPNLEDVARAAEELHSQLPDIYQRLSSWSSHELQSYEPVPVSN